MRGRFLLVLVVAALVAAAPLPSLAVDTWTQVMPGVQHLHRVTAVPQNIHALVIDLTNPHVRLRVGIKNDHDKGGAGETVQSMCSRYGAVAGINGDFWGGSPVSHCPQGHCAIDGLKMLPPGRTGPLNPNGTTMQISSANYVLINTVSFTPSWWHNVVAGGPRVIRNGVVGWETESDIPNMTVRDPRTGGAVSQDFNTLILATCDGRSAASAGMTANEMGALLQELGGHNGMMFDGGGSTSMVIGNSTVNVPSDGSPRTVANCLMVLDDLAQEPYPTVHYETGFECPPYVSSSLAGVDGWIGGGAVSDSRRTGAQGAEFTATSGWRSVSNGLLTGAQWVECWANASAAGGAGTAYLYSAGPTTADIASAVRFAGSNIEALDGDGAGGGTWMPLAPATAETWYRIAVRLDYTIDRYNVYIDGGLKASGFGFKMSSAGSGLRWIGFGETTGGTALCIDDIYAGNVDPDFARVSPDTATVVAGSAKLFTGVSGAAPLQWNIVQEKNPSGASVPAGTVAHIDSSGLLTANSPGSCIVRVTDANGRVDESGAISVVPSQLLSDLKHAADGAPAAVFGLKVAGAFDGFVYAQTSTAETGIRILTDQPAQIGDMIAATGVIHTLNGERVICADNFRVVAP